MEWHATQSNTALLIAAGFLATLCDHHAGFSKPHNDNGDTQEFTGQWDGYRHINGETDDGTAVELDTN